MISIIIYDDNQKMRSLYTRVINNFLFTEKDCYKFYEYEQFSSRVKREVKHIEGTRIYLINVDVPGPKGLDLARSIRSGGDYLSPIILITKNDKREIIDDIQNILFLDIIKQDENLPAALVRSMQAAHQIVTRHSVFSFSSFDEVYRIPYMDIYYIEKNLNDDSVTIYTKDDSYLHYITVKSLEKILNDPRFYKTHRSCIVNLYNISSYDRKNNIITFKNGLQSNLVARHNKAKLARKLEEYNNGSYEVDNQHDDS